MNSLETSYIFPRKIQYLLLLVLLLTAYFSEGFYRGDEHYQILEPANYILGNIEFDSLCWEFHSQIRPALQPYIASVFIHVFSILGVDSPFIYALLLRIITALISFAVIKKSYLFFAKYTDPQLLLYVMPFIWYVVYVSVRFSSETWSALFFMLALFSWFDRKSDNFLVLLLIGVLAGLSFQFRYQTALMSFGFFLWLLVDGQKFKVFLGLVLGFLTVLGLSVGLDTVFYDEFVFAPYNYFAVNLLEDKVSSFGVDPWYHYFTDLLNKTYLIYGLLMLTGLFVKLFYDWKSVVVFLILPFLFLHMAIGHKEMRFLFPLLYLTPFLICVAVDWIDGKVGDKVGFKRGFRYFFAFSNACLLLLVVFVSYNPIVKARHWLQGNATSKDVLYVIEDNPFSRGIGFTFYDVNNHPKVFQIKDTKEIVENSNGNVYLYISNRKFSQEYVIPERNELVFQSLPRLFTSVLNFNSWTDRTTIAKFYKLN